MTPDTERVDGRVQRGERTRGRIAEALLELLRDGSNRPTSQQIAERAGVSVRSVFQHYQDHDALYTALVDAQSRHVAPLLELDRPASLHERVAALAEQRRTLYEEIAPVRNAIGTTSAAAPPIRERLRQLGATLRSQVDEQFGDELAALDPGASERTGAALDMCSSYEAWRHLRDSAGLDADAAEAVVALTLHSLLARTG